MIELIDAQSQEAVIKVVGVRINGMLVLAGIADRLPDGWVHEIRTGGYFGEGSKRGWIVGLEIGNRSSRLAATDLA